MTSFVSTPIKKIILYGYIEDFHINSTAFHGISFQLCISDIIIRRVAKIITQYQNEIFNPIELQNQLQCLLESTICRDFALFRDLSHNMVNKTVEFICIALNHDIISIIQSVYPPSEFVVYDIIKNIDDAILKYPDYLENILPTSTDISSIINSLDTLIPIFDNRISKIPLPRGLNIYLSGDNGASDYAKLTKLGITHILNATDCIPNYFEETSNITYLRIPIPDCGSIILKDYFPKVFEFINSALELNGYILVHCFAGKSRSASFVIAYLMQFQGMSYNDAYKHVQNYRPIVEPNFGFEIQLHAFGEFLNNSNLMQ
jgi:protein-tyrosine phosphatase